MFDEIHKARFLNGHLKDRNSRKKSKYFLILT